MRKPYRLLSAADGERLVMPDSSVDIVALDALVSQPTREACEALVEAILGNVRLAYREAYLQAYEDHKGEPT